MNLDNFIKNNEIYIDIAVSLLMFVLFIVILTTIKNILRRIIKDTVEDDILPIFFGRILWILFITFGVIVFLGKIGFTSLSNKLLAGAGLTTFIIGFALKNIGENFLSGVILALSKPFKVGDIIQIDGEKGSVLQMTLRETIVKTSDGKDVFIPNYKFITSSMTNFTSDGFLRFDILLELRVHGKSLEELIDDIGKTKLLEFELFHTTNKEPAILFQKIKDKSFVLSIQYWIDIRKHEKINSNAKNKIITKIYESLSQLDVDIITIE